MTLEEFANFILGLVSDNIDENTHHPWAIAEGSGVTHPRFRHQQLGTQLYVHDTETDRRFVVSVVEA